jgi:hypothetical protein
MIRTFGEDPLYRKFDEYEGADEYSVYGWGKWDRSDAWYGWHNLIRLTQNDPSYGGNAENPGDRTLAIWVGPGFFHFTTYTEFYKGGDNWNVWNNINFEDDLESWWWIYFGYSRALKKTYAFVRFTQGDGADAREAFLRYDNIQHLIPTTTHVFLGKDKWHWGVNAELKGWNVQFGKGAYRETKFEELYTKDVFAVGDFEFPEPKDPAPALIETKVDDKII